MSYDEGYLRDALREIPEVPPKVIGACMYCFTPLHRDELGAILARDGRSFCAKAPKANPWHAALPKTAMP